MLRSLSPTYLALLLLTALVALVAAQDLGSAYQGNTAGGQGAPDGTGSADASSGGSTGGSSSGGGDMLSVMLSVLLKPLLSILNLLGINLG